MRDMIQRKVIKYGQLIDRTDIERGDIGVITTKLYKYQGKYYIELWENGCNVYFNQMIDY